MYALPHTVIDKKENIDWKRNGNLFMVGTFYLGPCLHLWYCKGMPIVINRTLGSNPSRMSSSVTGMLYDQLLFAPIFLSGFFVFQGVVNERSPKGISKGI